MMSQLEPPVIASLVTQFQIQLNAAQICLAAINAQGDGDCTFLNTYQKFQDMLTAIGDLNEASRLASLNTAPGNSTGQDLWNEYTTKHLISLQAIYGAFSKQDVHSYDAHDSDYGLITNWNSVGPFQHALQWKTAACATVTDYITCLTNIRTALLNAP